VRFYEEERSKNYLKRILIFAYFLSRRESIAFED
jgi:hypothetical protein